MVIEYYVIRNYGRDDRYVVDKNTAKALFLISGKKTLSDEVIQGFKMLGASFKEVVAPQK